jgi:hypothetical protein
MIWTDHSNHLSISEEMPRDIRSWLRHCVLAATLAR